MSFLEGASNVIITGGTNIAAGGSVTIHQPGGQTTSNDSLKELSSHTAHAALHNSAARFDAPRCHRNTRMSYLDGLERWMLGEGEDYNGARLIWLTGGAGAGKSAIMQSIVERAAKHKVVLGSFFFFRTDASRNYADVFIPTLAYQLASSFPDATTVINLILDRNPLIFKASLKTQAEELLVRPLQHLISAGIIDATSASQLVFVVDGLDECQDLRKQALVIQVIASILSDHDLPVSFLVASRPEVAISQAIQAEKRVHSMLATITLDETPEATSDIRQFIEDSFLDIRDTHPLREYIPANWPPPDSIDHLVWNSSGHFIYAATAMKFILSSDEHPERALRAIEGLEPTRTGSPFAELDGLYKHLITSAKYSGQILRILAHCCCSYLNNTVTSIRFMNPNYSPQDVALYLSNVTALVSLSLDNDAEMCVSLRHASLSDFLHDEKRSESLFVPSWDYLSSCLPRYFDMMDIDPKVAASQLQHVHRNGLDGFSETWSFAAYAFPDGKLLHRMISQHSPRDAWNLTAHCAPLFEGNRHNSVLDILAPYLAAIKSEAVHDHDYTLYTQQFGMFIQLLVNKIRFSHPECWFIPALLFSSPPACLKLPGLLMHQLVESGLFVSCGIRFPDAVCIHSPEQSRHLWRLPESQYWWGTDLAFIVKLVLWHLVNTSWVPAHLNADQHRQWVQQMKPMSQQSTGTPKLTSAFSTRLFVGLPSRAAWPNRYWGANARLRHAGYTEDAADSIAKRRQQCCIFLKAVVCYLPKSDCTREIAMLARRPLPREGELWFPKLAQAARKFMDAYVRRWEMSYEGVIEKTQSMAVNDVD